MKNGYREVKLERGKAPDCPMCGQPTKFSYFGGRCEVKCPSCGVMGDLPSPYSEIARLKVKR